MVEVYFYKGFTPGLINESDFVVNRDEYEKIAEIEADGYGEAYQIAQTVEKRWYRKKRAHMLDTTADYRSSYLGDIYVQENQMYIVLPVGFKLVNWGDTIDMRFKGLIPSL